MKTWHHHKKNHRILKEKSREIKISVLQGSRIFFNSITKFPSKTFYDIVIEAARNCIDYEIVREKKEFLFFSRESTTLREEQRGVI